MPARGERIGDLHWQVASRAPRIGRDAGVSLVHGIGRIVVAGVLPKHEQDVLGARVRHLCRERRDIEAVDGRVPLRGREPFVDGLRSRVGGIRDEQRQAASPVVVVQVVSVGLVGVADAGQSRTGGPAHARRSRCPADRAAITAHTGVRSGSGAPGRSRGTTGGTSVPCAAPGAVPSRAPNRHAAAVDRSSPFPTLTG